EASTGLLRAMGVESQMLEVTEARRMSPLIAAEGLLAGAYSPSGGYCAPESVVLGYATAARRLGARLIPHRAATGVVTEGRQVTAVTTDAGSIRTAAVICAAGA